MCDMCQKTLLYEPALFFESVRRSYVLTILFAEYTVTRYPTQKTKAKQDVDTVRISILSDFCLSNR